MKLNNRIRHKALTSRGWMVVVGVLMLLVSACEYTPRQVVVRTQPEPTEQQLFQGVQYIREVKDSPRPMVVHIVTIDLTAPGIRVLVTPPEDPEASRPLSARTTSEFVEGFGVQLAINGGGFKPWYANGFFYYPHTGDRVRPLGYAVSRGVQYGKDNGKQPILYFSPNNKASILQAPSNVYNALAGLDWIMQNDEALEDLDERPQPRTAVGVNRSGTKLVLVVVDGRQPGYSEGATLNEVVRIMRANGAWDAINLDGGGSSTLVTTNEEGEVVVLNSPIHQSVPGVERPVGNHLGIFAKAE